MRISRWIPKATNAHSQYIIVITFPLQQWLHESFTKLGYTHIACLVDIVEEDTQMFRNGNYLSFDTT
jgi:hypothetical protein